MSTSPRDGSFPALAPTPLAKDLRERGPTPGTAGVSTARAPAPPSPRRPSNRLLWLVVGALLALYAGMAWTASLSKGPSFEEPLQLAVGYNIWLNNDFRLEGANGDFIKRWATLPFLLSRPKFVGTNDSYLKGAMAYELGHRFLFELGNRPESLLQQGRAMMALLGVAAGLLVFWCSRQIFGAAGGLVSLGLFVFSPNMLAFGGIVSTDLSIILTLFGSTWCIWRLLHEITWQRVLASLGLFGLMLLAKASALVIFPIAALLLAVRFAAGGPLIVHWRGEPRRVMTRRAHAGVFAVLVLLHAISGWTAIWAHYGFRYDASPKPADPSLVMYEQPYRDHVSPLLATIVNAMERARFLPQGYVKGIDSLLGNDDELGAFKKGEWYVGGRPSFFPYAVWVKTQPALVLLLVLGGMVWWRASRHSRGASAPAPASETPHPPALYAATPHAALILCYLVIAMRENLNIGHRHVLPIYPSLYVLAGAVAIGWPGRAAAIKAAVVLSLAWLVVDSLAIRPHYLAYFGPQAGGPKSGYKHLVDSSLDWGMNLPGLREWLDKHDPDREVPLFLGYFGTDSARYHGIKSRRLPGFFDRRNLEHYLFEPGYYAISASLLQGVYTAAFGPWSNEYEARYRIAAKNIEAFARTESDPAKRLELIKRTSPQFWEAEFDHFDNLRFARLCAWLRHQGDPPHHVGHALFIWKLDYAALHAALAGPAVELVDAPPNLRRFRQFEAARP